MQQRQKATPAQNKTQSLALTKPAKSRPVVLDEKALRQVAGGILQGPNGSW